MDVQHARVPCREYARGFQHVDSRAEARHALARARTRLAQNRPWGHIIFTVPLGHADFEPHDVTGLRGGEVVIVDHDLQHFDPLRARHQDQLLAHFYLTALDFAQGKDLTLAVCTGDEDPQRAISIAPGQRDSI